MKVRYQWTITLSQPGRTTIIGRTRLRDAFRAIGREQLRFRDRLIIMLVRRETRRAGPDVVKARAWRGRLPILFPGTLVAVPVRFHRELNQCR
jgi:hypothetical protein